MTRRGFTLVELLIAMVVTALLGVALTRLLISDSRFVSRQEAMLQARMAARAAMNVMTVELQMVSDSGLIAAAPESVTVAVPYVFGLACQTVSGRVIATLMPTDSLMYAQADSVGPDGLAKRVANNAYDVRAGGITVTASTNTAACSADSIRVVPNGSLVEIAAPGPSRPSSGQIFYLYQEVTYKFATSTELPGRIALWRKTGSSAYEELVVPFDSSAGFGFLLGPNMVASDTVPTNISMVRGLELRLTGQSEGWPSGDTKPQDFELVTRVAFRNRAN